MYRCLYIHLDGWEKLVEYNTLKDSLQKSQERVDKLSTYLVSPATKTSNSYESLCVGV